MASSLMSFSCLVYFVLLFPTLSTSQNAFVCSRATFYGNPYSLGTASGTCGFGEFGSTLNGGNVAAVSDLFRHGAGCGACYQVRCTYPGLCNENGVTVVATDHGHGDHTDFILSGRSFSNLALPNMAEELMAYGVVDIEFKRVSCQYPGHNLMFKVTEHSNYPYYIALTPIYQGGMKDIVAVQIWQEDCHEWKEMRRAYGGVWDMANPPRGPLNLRLQVSGEDGQKPIIPLGQVIPGDWQCGAVYDSNLQFH
ncbi:expansin-like B1 [Nymphaea colorata]|nr:expansin-like B1 [Nymphaea colorata]